MGVAQAVSGAVRLPGCGLGLPSSSAARLRHRQATPARAPRRCGVRVTAYKSPVHQKYVTMTKEEIDAEYAKEWLDTTAHQAAQVREPTLWSVLWYLPMFIRFRLIPEPLRYLLHLAWLPLRPWAAAAHTKMLVAGAKLDAALVRRQKRTGGRMFSCQEVLRRRHGKASPLRKIQYRIDLFQGKTIEQLDEEALAAEQEEAARLAAAIEVYKTAAPGVVPQPP